MNTYSRLWNTYFSVILFDVVPEKAKRPRGRSSVRCLHESIQGSKFEYESGPKEESTSEQHPLDGIFRNVTIYASACKVRFKNATPDRGVARGRNCNRDKCVFCTSRSHASTGPMEFQKDVLLLRIDTYPNPNFHGEWSTTEDLRNRVRRYMYNERSVIDQENRKGDDTKWKYKFGKFTTTRIKGIFLYSSFIFFRRPRRPRISAREIFLRGLTGRY